MKITSAIKVGILFLIVSLPNLVLAQGKDSVLFRGGLVEDCKERIDRYLSPAGAGKQKNINLAKYPSWDLSKEFLRPNWNATKQGAQGSCTSFAVSYAISIQRNADNWLLKHKRSFEQYSPAFIFNLAKSNYSDPFRSKCDEGISFIDAYLVVRDRGVSTIESCPYSPISDGCKSSNYPSKEAFNSAKQVRIGNFQRPFLRVDVLKTMLVDTPFHPVCIGVYLSSEYDEACDKRPGKLKPGQKAGEWKLAGVSDGTRAHAMLIVGFDNSKNAFKVLDWRGANNGDNGVIWLDYGLVTNANVVFDAYVVSHSLEYLDPMLGARAGEAQESDEPEKDKDNDSNSWSFWIKQNYYTIKGGLHVLSTYVSSATNSATFKITDETTDEIIIDDLFLRKGGSREFKYKGETFQMTLVEVARRGNPLNIAKPYAAVIRLNKLQ